MWIDANQWIGLWLEISKYITVCGISIWLFALLFELSCLVCMFWGFGAFIHYEYKTRTLIPGSGGFKIETIFRVPMNMDLCSMWHTQNTVRFGCSGNFQRIEIRLCIANATKCDTNLNFRNSKGILMWNTGTKSHVLAFCTYSLEFDMLFSTKYSISCDIHTNHSVIVIIMVKHWTLWLLSTYNLQLNDIFIWNLELKISFCNLISFTDGVHCYNFNVENWMKWNELDYLIWIFHMNLNIVCWERTVCAWYHQLPLFMQFIHRFKAHFRNSA